MGIDDELRSQREQYEEDLQIFNRSCQKIGMLGDEAQHFLPHVKSVLERSHEIKTRLNKCGVEVSDPGESCTPSPIYTE